jgi:hypothetical protein
MPALADAQARALSKVFDSRSQSRGISIPAEKSLVQKYIIDPTLLSLTVHLDIPPSSSPRNPAFNQDEIVATLQPFGAGRGSSYPE